MSRVHVALVPLVLFAFNAAAQGDSIGTAGADAYVGSFVGDKLSIEVKREAQDGAYVGMIHFGARQFPFTANRNGRQIDGAFNSGADSFDFTATLADRRLTFTTGGATYLLSKVAPESLRPVSRPTVNETPTARPTTTATTGTDVLPPDTPHLESVVVFDAMMACDAATLRAPRGWKSSLDVVWRPNPFDPAVIAGAVSESGRPTQLTIYPRLSFIEKSPASSGGSYMGSEVRQPVDSPADYVRRVILPRFRTDIGAPRFVAETGLPDFARDQLPKFQKLPGVRVDAARVRLNYALNGSEVEEEFVCTIGTVPLPDGTVTWGAECVSYRSARGQLKAALPLLRDIESSLNVDMQWYGGVLEVSQKMQDGATGDASDAARLTRYVSQRSTGISDVARGSYERRAQVIAACNEDLDAALGVVASSAGNPTSQNVVNWRDLRIAR